MRPLLVGHESDTYADKSNRVLALGRLGASSKHPPHNISGDIPDRYRCARRESLQRQRIPGTSERKTTALPLPPNLSALQWYNRRGTGSAFAFAVATASESVVSAPK